ncbi:MAG: hypothetical protein JRE27_04705 [Deltaproteobacteria bacterium]|nr:hypothetical protein [Deltaproteobacteria bacterium]
MTGLLIQAYDKSAGSCVAGIGVAWHHYSDIWENCDHAFNGSGDTGNSGEVTLEMAPGDYLIIAEVDPDDDPNNINNIYLGVSAGDLDSGEVMQKYLQLIVKDNGKKVPGKYTKKSGSEILVIEPEYIEWDGTQELYPFIFDSVGDWSVTTSVIPPEGFVTDNDNLSEEVNSELEALQFTIIDVGSEWKSTCVEHTLTHKKKKQKVYSTVGVNLTKQLAEEKEIDLEAFQEAREAEHERLQQCHEEFQEAKQEDKPKKGRKK